MSYYHGEDWQDVLAEEVLDPEEEEESFEPLTDLQLTAVAPSGVAPTSEAAAAPSGVALRPIGAGVGLETFDLNEGVGQEDRHSFDLTSSNQSGPGTL